MRTTVDLPEHLLIDAKKLAASRHLSLTKLVQESLRFYLADQRRRRSAQPSPPLPVLCQPRALIDLDDTSRLLELE